MAGKKPAAACPFMERARQLTAGWDMRHLESEWSSWVIEKGIAVKNPDKHFLSFCKKRGPYKR